ncbi:MAG: ribonuclease domain-containing protein [Synergistota bacterium]|nr:ribonuclease domain-containing protein [Synergistota bacterium]
MEKIKLTKWFTAILAVALLVFGSIYLSNAKKEMSADSTVISVQNEAADQVKKDAGYSTKDDVAEYIHKFGSLPPNYITKKDAQAAGWESNKGNLWQVTDRQSIGGDLFGNREGLLPKASGRKYFECDINYNGGYRGPERIVYSNDGLIFYSGDHYRNFERLY